MTTPRTPAGGTRLQLLGLLTVAGLLLSVGGPACTRSSPGERASGEERDRVFLQGAAYSLAVSPGWSSGRPTSPFRPRAISSSPARLRLEKGDRHIQVSIEERRWWGEGAALLVMPGEGRGWELIDTVQLRRFGDIRGYSVTFTAPAEGPPGEYVSVHRRVVVVGGPEELVLIGFEAPVLSPGFGFGGGRERMIRSMMADRDDFERIVASLRWEHSRPQASPE